MTHEEAWRLRRPAVAGTFYPAVPSQLESLVRRELREVAGTSPLAAGKSGAAGAANTARAGAARSGPAVAANTTPAGGATYRSAALPADSELLGLLVPHAGLIYSGAIAAAGWRLLASPAPVGRGLGGDQVEPLTIVLLGTNHGAGWLDGVGIWDSGSWLTPLGGVGVDEPLAGAILQLGPPFVLDRAAHLDEHSIEIQLPAIQLTAPKARIVPLAVSAGTGEVAVSAGRRLGELLATRRAAGERIVLGISSDMAHYPPADVCEAATEALLPSIVALDAHGLALAEASLRHSIGRGLVCGMCGIEPAVFGLAAFGAMAGGDARATVTATPIAAATSADAGGSGARTVGYLTVAFTTGGSPRP